MRLTARENTPQDPNVEFYLDADGLDEINIFANGWLIAWFEMRNGKITLVKASSVDKNLFNTDKKGEMVVR